MLKSLIVIGLANIRSKMMMERLKGNKSKGVATRFLALLILAAIVFMILVFILYTKAPDLFEKLFNLITKPFEEENGE